MNFKVIVVEDEPPILNNIVKKLESLDLPIEVAGTAFDGNEALKLAEQVHPHLVLTDIKMPGMDGLTLCEQLQCTCPWVRIVIVSGYDDFEYARRAVKYQVSDYILKPVNKNELYQTMEKLCTLLAREEDAKYRQLLSSHLSGSPLKEDFAGQFLGQQFGAYLICFGNLMDMAVGAIDKHYYESLWQDVNIENLVCRLSPSCDSSWLLPEKCLNEGILLTAHYDSTLLSELSSALHELLDGDISVAVCGTKTGIDFDSLQQTIRMLRITVKNARVLCSSQCLETDYRNSFSKKLFHEHLLAVQNALSRKQPNIFRSSLQKFLTFSFAEEVPQKYIEDGLKSIVNAFPVPDSISGQTGNDELLSRLYDMIALARNTDFLTERLCEMLCQTFTDTFQEEETGLELARNIKTYIDLNYQKDITIRSLVDAFHFSPTYIRRVFHLHYGVSPMKYLLQYRMEQAKKLLCQQENLSVSYVAYAVGYEDPHYFSRIFRSAIGQSPSEYKTANMEKNTEI